MVCECSRRRVITLAKRLLLWWALGSRSFGGGPTVVEIAPLVSLFARPIIERRQPTLLRRGKINKGRKNLGGAPKWAAGCITVRSHRGSGWPATWSLLARPSLAVSCGARSGLPLPCRGLDQAFTGLQASGGDI